MPEEEWVVVRGEEVISHNADRYAALGINLTNFPIRAITEEIHTRRYTPLDPLFLEGKR